jgi:hypothetical protein
MMAPPVTWSVRALVSQPLADDDDRRDVSTRKRRQGTGTQMSQVGSFLYYFLSAQVLEITVFKPRLADPHQYP